MHDPVAYDGVSYHLGDVVALQTTADVEALRGVLYSEAGPIVAFLADPIAVGVSSWRPAGAEGNPSMAQRLMELTTDPVCILFFRTGAYRFFSG